MLAPLAQLEAAVAIRPQRLPVGAFRLQLEDLALLDHLEPPRSMIGSRNHTHIPEATR